MKRLLERRRPWGLVAGRRGIFLLGILCGVAILFGGRLLINETTFADKLVAPLLVRDTPGPADAIVVMGAGVVGECGVSLNSARRVLLAFRVWRAGRAPQLLFTGGRASGIPTCPVAVAMAALAREIRVPDENIHVEAASRNTRENAELSAPLLRRLGAARLIVVTDRLHMTRSARVFEQLGFHVERAAVPVYEGHRDNVDMLTAAAREGVALSYYKLRGWIGGQPQRREEVEGLPEPVMPFELKNPSGPVVLLGASYAGGWDPKTIGATPVINRGVPGQQSFEMLERFERDVVAVRPRAVILWGFINDVFRAPGGDPEKALARARDSYTRMLQLARENGIEPILASEVTVRPLDTWTETLALWVGTLRGKEAYQDRINGHVIAMNRWLVDVARREGVLLLDLQSTLAEAGGRRRREYTQHDGSHISPAGYRALTEYATPILEKHLHVP